MPTMNNIPVEIDLSNVAAVIGRNPECADVNNPRGEIVALRWFLIATADDGSRWEHAHRFDDSVAAARLAKRAEAAAELSPQHWTATRPEYGSEAYERDGCELDQIEFEADPANW